MQWLRSTFPFCWGRRGWMYRCRMPACSHPEDKVERELCPVIRLHLVDRKREALADLLEEREAAALVLLPRQPQHPKSGAIVQRGVLKAFALVHLDDLDVDLHGVTGVRLLEEAQLLRAWGPLPATRQVRDSHASEGVLDGGHRQMDLVHAPQPDPRAGRAVLELPPRVLEERDRRRRQPGRPLRRISWNQAGDALGPVAIAPLADRLAVEAKMLTCAEQTVRLHIGHDAHRRRTAHRYWRFTFGSFMRVSPSLD
jgi:hypothetical protein